MDYLSYFVETITEDFMEHLKSYKNACAKVQLNDKESLINSFKLKKIEEAYFEEGSCKNPWKVVCSSPDAKLGRYTVFFCFCFF